MDSAPMPVLKSQQLSIGRYWLVSGLSGSSPVVPATLFVGSTPFHWDTTSAPTARLGALTKPLRSAQLAEGDSQPECADGIFSVLPFADPKFKPGSNPLLEPVGEAAAAVDHNPGLPGEVTTDAK
jgi:hypothetical protein